MDTSKLYADLALGFGVLIIGFSAIFTRWAEAPGTVTMFYRMTIGALLVLIPFCRRVKVRTSHFPRHPILMAILGGVFFGMDTALWSTGVVMSGATIPTLMVNTAPLWVGLGSWLIFRERQNIKFWIGLSVALLGTIIVSGEDIARATEFGLGSLCGLGAALFYAAFYLTTQQARIALDTLTYFGISTLSSSVFLFVLNLLLGRPFFGYSGMTYLNFLAVGVIVQVFGWMLINYAQGHLTASVVSPTLLGQPVITAIFAGPLLGETLTTLHIGGGIAVLTGIFIIHRSRL